MPHRLPAAPLATLRSPLPGQVASEEAKKGEVSHTGFQNKARVRRDKDPVNHVVLT